MSTESEVSVMSVGCSQGGQFVKCHQYVDQCYDRSRLCIFDMTLVDERRQFHVQSTCRDGYHLRKNCGQFYVENVYIDVEQKIVCFMKRWKLFSENFKAKCHF